MLRLLIDENINDRIVHGLKRRLPRVDFVKVKDVGLAGAADVELLQWAAQQNRVIVSHDVQTMIHHAEEMIKSGKPMAGVILIPQRLSIGAAINDLEIAVECLSHADARDDITYLPL